MLAVSSKKTGSALALGMAIGSILSLLFSTTRLGATSYQTGVISCVGMAITAVFIANIGPVFAIAGMSSLVCAFAIQRFFQNVVTSNTRSLQVEINKEGDIRELFWVISLTFSLGVTLGPILGEMVITHASFRYTLLLSATFCMVCAINYISLPRRGMPERTVTEEISTGQFEPLGVLACAATVIAYGIYSQTFSYIQLQIDHAYGAQGAKIARDFFVVYATFRILSALYAYPWLSRKMASPVAIYVKGSFVCYGSLVVATFHTGYWTLIAVAAAFATGEALFAPISVPFVTSTVQRQSNLPVHIALFTFCSTALGIGGGQALGVYLFDLHDPMLAAAAWTAGFLTLAAICALLRGTITISSTRPVARSPQ